MKTLDILCDSPWKRNCIKNERHHFALAGVTQELIDETRLSTEKNMLNDLKLLADREIPWNSSEEVGKLP